MHVIQISDREFLNLSNVAKVHFKADDKHAEVILSSGEKTKVSGKEEIEKLKGRLLREAKRADSTSFKGN